MPNNHSENRRILIIDDERPILLTLEALLGRHGYQPDTAATASYGLRRIKESSPALVLLDLQLPDGRARVQPLRARGRTSCRSRKSGASSSSA